MEFKKTAIEGVYVIEPRVFNDARGYFFEAWKKEEFEQNIGKVEFVQDNESKSSYGVLRGLHYQKGDASQAKEQASVLYSPWFCPWLPGTERRGHLYL